jgi:uncharacterized protein YegL
MMANWTAEVFENEYLADGASDVHAVLTVTCADVGDAETPGDAAEVLIIDTSGSMREPHSKITSARKAAAVAIDAIDEGTFFAIIAGMSHAFVLFPPHGGMVRADTKTREAAKTAVARLDAEGGTAIGAWLSCADGLFETTAASKRHAIMLTDGKNGEDDRTFGQILGSLQGRFQCDCRGVGADWEVNQLRQIASALLGSVDLIADPAQMAEDFASMMATSMSRGIASASVRVWAPQGAEVLFVRQVAPAIEDLTAKRTVVSDLIGDYPTGAWGDESRDYHVAVRVPPKPVGAEQLAARVQIVVGGQVQASGLVRATWSDDATLTTRINPAVAHYTGQAELASVIQDGLAAKAAGDDATATVKLGRAAQLAAQTGNDDATAKLQKVVDIQDAETGTVRLKRGVDKLDEMALDTSSTKTTRVKP